MSIGFNFINFNNKILKKVSVLGSLNLGFNIANGGGKLKSAYPGDPGYYDGEFHKPGSDFSITASSTPALNLGASFKYHLSKYIFLELEYNHILKSTLNKYDAKLDGEKIKLAENPKDIKINNYNIIGLSVGFGI